MSVAYGVEYYVRTIGALWGIETVSLRVFNAYGPGQRLPPTHPPVVPYFLKQALGGGTLVVNSDGSLIIPELGRVYVRSASLKDVREKVRVLLREDVRCRPPGIRQCAGIVQNLSMIRADSAVSTPTHSGQFPNMCGDHGGHDWIERNRKS